MASQSRLVGGVVLLAMLCACSGGNAPSPSPATTVQPTQPATATPAATSPAATSPAATSPTGTASTAPATASLPSPVDITQAGAIEIPGTARVDWTVAVNGSAWIAGLAQGAGQLMPDGKAGLVALFPGQCEAMDVGFDAIWSATCAPGGIVRIDPSTGTVKTASLDARIVDDEGSVGAGEGALWIVTGIKADQLTKVDPQTLKVLATYPIESGACCVRAGLGGVWISNPAKNHLIHVDPTTGTVVATIELGRAPRFLAVGENGVWVMNQFDGTVSHVDPATDTVVATIDAGPPIDGGDIAVGGGAVWLRGGPELLARIDPVTDTVTDRYGPPVGSGSVAADDDNVWITAHDVSKIWRLPLAP